MNPEETLLSFEESYQQQPWYGESLVNLIDRMTLEDVNFRPTGKTKTAGERLAHIIAWRRLILERLKGNGENIDMSGENNFPRPDTYTEQSWQDLISELKSTHVELLEWIPKIEDPSTLVPGSKGNDGKPYSYDYLIRGLIEHDIYHQGQMALLVAIAHSS